MEPEAVERVRGPASGTTGAVVFERHTGLIVVPVVGGAPESLRVAVTHRKRV
jgi:hypothetical protein